jgi:uncharacterized membrane protein
MHIPGTNHHFRFHRPHAHLASPFGEGWFGEKAESFARFFGTPTFLIGQTLIVGAWITANVVGMFHFDVYPFILLNLAFSLQAAYAAPLILLAQTRQADRDKCQAEADAAHREDLARAALERQEIAAREAVQLKTLLEQNTQLTEQVASQIKTLTEDIHARVAGGPQGA